MRSTISTISDGGQLREDHHVVDTVEELRPEVLLELLVDLRLHPVVVGGQAAAGGEADGDALGDVPGAEVRGHDDDGVLEVHHAALRVGQATVLEDLQQRVEDVDVRLLHLVEQHDGERLATHLLGELAALVVADVAGGASRTGAMPCASRRTPTCPAG